MIVLYILSIFDKLRIKIKYLDYKKFYELIPESVIGSEVIEFLKRPFELCLGYKSLAFTKPETTAELLNKHQETKNSILKLLD